MDTASNSALLVFIEEEYGWRYWRWEYPGTADELRADWKAGRVPKDLGYVASVPGFRGTITEIEPMADYWERVEAGTEGLSDEAALAVIDANEKELVEELGREWSKFLAGFGAQAHIHEEDDTWLQIGDEMLPWPFKYDEEAGLEERLANPLPKER